VARFCEFCRIYAFSNQTIVQRKVAGFGVNAISASANKCETPGHKKPLAVKPKAPPQLFWFLLKYLDNPPTTVSRKYVYSDDLAIMHADGNWQAVKGMLSKDMSTAGEYLHIWKLKLSTTKTVSAVFHLDNKEAKRELKANYSNEILPFWPESKYLGVTLDRSLTFRRHLESSRKKLTPRVALLKRLAGSGWGAVATTLRIATLALVHPTAEYCATVWCRSAHTRLIDPAINDALRIVTGCLRPTPVDNLPILASIQPAELRHRGATLSLGRRAMEPGHLLHSALTRPSGAAARRLKSRHLFALAAQ